VPEGHIAPAQIGEGVHLHIEGYYSVACWDPPYIRLELDLVDWNKRIEAARIALVAEGGFEG
jgi:hypothetical protein